MWPGQKVTDQRTGGARPVTDSLGRNWRGEAWDSHESRECAIAAIITVRYYGLFDLVLTPEKRFACLSKAVLVCHVTHENRFIT